MTFYSRFDLLAETVLTHLIVSHNPYPNDYIVEDYRNELRSFVIRNPRRAASMSTQIAMKREREFIKDERPKLYNGKHNVYEKFDELEQRPAPWGHLPWLEIDDRVLTQSWAIARYLAQQFGYAGGTPFECAQVDALADQFKDYWNEMSPFFYAMYLNDPEIAKQAKAVGKDMGNARENFEKQKKEVGEKGRDKFYGILAKEYKKNGSTGRLVGSSLTWIDLVVVDHMGVVDYFAPGFLDDFEEIRELQKKVNAIPKLQEWLKKRKHTPQ
ncbi:hypothetical protein PRIPAC_83845 [Pristionchus pacificus]|nr:hypothetical protein PRIPAC_83845 [Pristionchus pacificus]|eukprot:PDM69526.1 Glutathione S-transferase [Pristionchus pacificus]